MKTSFKYLQAGWGDVLLIMVLVAAAGCQSEPARQKTELLPEAAPGVQNFSDYRPQKPYAQITPTLLSRTVLQTNGPPGIAIEFRDLYVPSGKTAENITLPGAATFEVRYGQGKMTSLGKSLDIRGGRTWAVSQGDSFSLASEGDTPLIVRARIFMAQ